MKTFTYTLLIFLVLGALIKLDAQSCSPGTLTTQAQVSDVGANCTSIVGDLIIEGSGITDLNPLQSITSVTGDLIIRNCSGLVGANGITGLESVLTIGGDFIIENNGIGDVSPFTFSLTTIEGNLEIKNNGSLIPVDIFTQLETIGGNLTIEANGNLDRVRDFTSLIEIGGDLNLKNNANLRDIGNIGVLEIVSGNISIWTSNALESVDFPSLAEVGGAFTVLQNGGNFNLNGFNSLGSIENGIQIAANPGLNQVNGFNGLAFTTTVFIENSSVSQVNGFQTMQEANIVSIKNNLLLVTINGFGGLETVNSVVEIINNGAISSLTGFGSLQTAGRMIIEDNGTPALRSPASLMDLNAFNSLTTVNSDLFINNNFIFTGISGFSSLDNCINLNIKSNFGLTSISGFAAFDRIKNQLNIQNNGQLTSISGLQALRAIDDQLRITDNDAINSIGNFNTVASGTVIISNTNLIAINGFSSHASGGVSIADNPELTSITAWQNIVSGPGYEISSNPKLTTVDGFQNFTSGIQVVNIEDNGMLSMCCFALPSIATATTVSVSGNATGCTNVAQINQAPVLNNCPADVTINTGSDICAVEISFTDPTITDNCGYTSYTYSIIDYGNNNSGNGNEGVTYPYFFGPGINSITWEVIDESGNNDVCVTTITVVDNVFPQFTTDLPATASISTSSSTCEVTHSITFPAATDNCGITGRELTIFNQSGGPAVYANYSAVEGQTYNIPLEPGVYDLEARVYDAGSFADVTTTVITVTDDTGPEYTSTIPSDITIFTGSNSCSKTHTFTFPTFSDNCPGVSSNFSVLNENKTQVIFDQAEPNGGSTYNVDLVPGVYFVEFYLIDANDNENDAVFYITVQDKTGPIITLNQADVTVNCNETPPSIPQIGSSVFGNDACSGDVTSNMTATSSTSSGDCTFNQEQTVTTYTYTASDNDGNTSEKSFIITILNNEAVDLGADKIGCTGENLTLSTTGLSGSYLWSTGATAPTINVATAGTYAVTVTGTSGCCSIDEVNVSFQNDPDASAQGGVLGCTTTEIQLTGASTSSGVTFSWTGPGGFTSIAQNPTVSSLGEYVLTVSTSAGCSTTANATVSADTDVPNAAAQGGSLNCTNSDVQLMGSSTTSGVSYSWTGPNSYTSADQNPTVSVAGIYTLTVKAANDCSITADAEVIDDTAIPVVTLVGGMINCTTPEIILAPELAGDIESFTWTGPNGLTTTSETLTVTAAGTYAVTVTGSNTCSGSTSIIITEDTEIPNISAEGGMIDCSAAQVTLTGGSTTPGVTFAWEGPAGFMANVASPVVVTPGTYTLIVSAPNGCSASETVEITSDMEIPSVSAIGGSIDCINTSISIEATSANEGLTYTWIGPAGFTASSALIEVTSPGTYTVTAINANGCSAQAIVEVLDNSTPPSVTASAGNLDCVATTSAVSIIGSDDIISYGWTGPDAFVSSESEPTLLTPGTYELIVTAENGCTATTSVTITSDTTVPDASATGGALSCTANSVSLSVNSTTAGVTYAWSGPDNFTSDLQNPEVTQAGTYTVVVTSGNGCFGEATAEVTADTDLPDVSALGGTIDCNNAEVTLMGSTTTTATTISWTGPNGFTSTDNNPVVSVFGEYTFTVLNAVGCSAFKTVMVVEDKEDPVVALSLGDVSCENGTISINPDVVEGLAFSWTGPGGFTSDMAIPEVSVAGNYSVIIIGANGCSSSATINLENDVVFSATVTVDGDGATIDITNGYGPFKILWDDGSIGTSVSSQTNGDHTVSITDILGCEQVVTFTILSSSTDDLLDLIEVEAFPNPTQNLITIQWNKSAAQVHRISILDKSGRVLRDYKGSDYNSVGKLQVEVSDWTQGLYLIRMMSDEAIGFIKFIKI